MKKLKIVIWGYPLHTHTHSYIHNSFYKAFNFLGHSVYWFDDNNYPDGFDFTNCIFLTEGFADTRIPLEKTSTYFVHVCVNPHKYLGNVKKLIDVRYLQEKMENDNYNFVLDRKNCIELDKGVLYDKESGDYEICYASWGTDLLPHEINDDWADFKRENIYYFIGSVSQSGRFANGPFLNRFVDCCSKNGINHIYIDPWSNPVDDATNRELMQKSILSPDFRNQTHKEWGYLACRLFKSISYGQLGLTNSSINAKFIDDSVIFDDDIPNLFEMGMSNRHDKDRIRHQMNLVKNNHTYINRIEGLLQLI